MRPARKQRRRRRQPPQPPPRPTAARPPIQQAPQPPATRQPTPPADHAPQPPAQQPAAGPSIANLNLRPTAAPSVRAPAPPPAADKPAPAAAKPSRWDKPAEPPRPHASAASRFAPPRAAQPQPPQSGNGLPPAPPLAADLEDEAPFGEGLPFGAEAEETTEEFPLDGFDMVPGYGDEDQIVPYPDEELGGSHRRGVPRSLVAVAGILALVLIGVLAVVMFRPNGTSVTAPPIIVADNSPTKVDPPVVQGQGDSEQNKLIYDRVDSGTSNATADTKLVTPGSEPIAPVPSTNNDNPIARVILPGGPSPEPPGAADTGAAAADNGDVAMNEDSSASALGPRKVRTVVVRPDGTIVSSDAVPAEGDAPASVDATPQQEVAVAPPAPPLPTNDDTNAIAGGQSGQELAITPIPGSNGAVAEAPAETPAPAAPVRAPTPPAPKPTPKVVATGGDGGPVDLTPGKSATQVANRAAAAPVSGSGMMVQVSSQRSQDAASATYRDLQTRYPGILGSYNADIQRADLGDRGTYYRVRVGPFAPSDAQKLCDSLKSAGGDCILAQR